MIYDAEIVSYDRPARLCRVKIPPYTDGCEEYPIAEIMNMVGDKAWHTEYRILAGDLCSVMFKNGDPRFPVIIGYRCPQKDNNVVGFRRWHMENIESDAASTQKHTAGEHYEITAVDYFKVTVGASVLEMTPEGTTLTTPDYRVDSPLSTFTGDVRVDKGITTGEDVVTDAGSSSNTHTHLGNLGKPTSVFIA